MRLYQHLTAPNDVNGNPRRLWAVYRVNPENGNAVVEAVHDEGHRGREAVRKLNPLSELPSVNISGRECREWLEYAEAKV